MLFGLSVRKHLWRYLYGVREKPSPENLPISPDFSCLPNYNCGYITMKEGSYDTSHQLSFIDGWMDICCWDIPFFVTSPLISIHFIFFLSLAISLSLISKDLIFSLSLALSLACFFLVMTFLGRQQEAELHESDDFHHFLWQVVKALCDGAGCTSVSSVEEGGVRSKTSFKVFFFL